MKTTCVSFKWKLDYCRACFKKNSSLHIWPKHFWTTILSLQNSDDLFFSHRPFYRFLPFRLLQMMTPITYWLHPITPSIHTHMLFFTFLHLALCSRNNKYSMRHLFLLSSSLHKQPFITAHFRSSLHTKTSPGNNLVNIVGLQLVSK